MPIRAALILCLALLPAMPAPAAWGKAPGEVPQVPAEQNSSRPARAVLEPTPAAQVVAQLVARIFEQTHYNHRPIDEALSRQWLQDYLESYDYNHMFFEKSDVDEFRARYGDRMGDLVRNGDLTPAYEIFERFLKRAQERKAQAEKFAASTFTFTEDESLVVDRHELLWPADEKESASLWRLRVKFDVLQERLGGAKPEAQVKTVLTRYDRLLRSFKEFDANDVLQALRSAMKCWSCGSALNSASPRSFTCCNQS